MNEHNKLSIAFVCVHNSCRSQMAEALMKHLAGDLFDVYSAGTENYHEVKPGAVQVIEEMDISMDGHYPKLLDAIPESIDILITMGCNVQCPFVPHRYMTDWGLDDPSGGPIDDYRKTRDVIEQKCKQLINDVKVDKLFV